MVTVKLSAFEQAIGLLNKLPREQDLIITAALTELLGQLEGLRRERDLAYRAAELQRLVLETAYQDKVRAEAERDRAVGLLRETLNQSRWQHAPTCYWMSSRSTDDDDCDCGTNEHARAVAALLREVDRA